MTGHFTVSSTLYTVALFAVCLFLDLAEGGVKITMEIAGQKLFGKVVAGRLNVTRRLLYSLIHL